MDLLKEKTYEMKRNIESIPEEILNGYIIYTKYFHQYAAGVTGANRSASIYCQPDGKPYPYAAAAYKAAKDAGIKPYKKNGRETPYGEIGAEEFTREAITVRDYLNINPYHASLAPTQFKAMPMPKTA